MQLTLERFGGIAGVPAKPLILDTSQLPKAQAELLETLAQRVLDERREARVAPTRQRAPQPDAHSYELTIEGAQQSEAIPFDNAEASASLRELVKAMRSAKSP